MNNVDDNADAQYKRNINMFFGAPFKRVAVTLTSHMFKVKISIGLAIMYSYTHSHAHMYETIIAIADALLI